MAPGFQSSFIPKDPVTEQAFQKKKAGFIGVLAVSLFLSSVVIAVGVYVYQVMLKGDIESLKEELAQAEKSIDKKTIGELSDFAKKIDIAKKLVDRHHVVTNFLDVLSSSTVRSVQFSEFSYSGLKETELLIKLSGKADSYAAVALQDSVLSKVKEFRSLAFSNMGLNEKGSVIFDLEIKVDPELSVYSP